MVTVNLVEALRQVAQDLLVPELRALQVEVRQQRERTDSLEHRLESVEHRLAVGFDAVDKRLDRTNEILLTMSKQLGSLQGAFTERSKHLDVLLGQLVGGSPGMPPYAPARRSGVAARPAPPRPRRVPKPKKD